MELLTSFLDVGLLGAVFAGDKAASGVDAVLRGFDTADGWQVSLLDSHDVPP